MKIVVIGSGYSGSGAVYDYLAGRADVTAALGGEEFRLIQDPGGIVDLHHAIGSGFYFTRADHAVREFRALAYRAARPQRAAPPGMGYARTIPGYRDAVHAYLDEIVELKYPGTPLYRVQRMPAWRALSHLVVRRVLRHLGRRPKSGEVALPVDEARFLAATERFLGRLFPQRGPVVINQGGSFWSPDASTRYYGARRVVVVTRDPRDIFADIRDRGWAFPGHDAAMFGRWYRALLARRVPESSEHVLHVRFEDFVLSHDEWRARIDAFLGLTPGPSTYDPGKSAPNVGKHRRILTDDEIAALDRELDGVA